MVLGGFFEWTTKRACGYDTSVGRENPIRSTWQSTLLSSCAASQRKRSVSSECCALPTDLVCTGMGPRGERPPKPAGDGGRGRGGRGGRCKGAGDDTPRPIAHSVVPAPAPNGPSVPKPNVLPLPSPNTSSSKKPPPRAPSTGAGKKTTAERDRAEQRVREEQARVAAAAFALEAQRQAVLDEETRLRDLQDEELRKIQAARAERNRLRSITTDPAQKIPPETIKKGDSSIKKNTALSKKLGKVSEESRATTLADLQTTNCGKYLTEAAAALVSCKLKAPDVAAVVEVCSFLHRAYGSEFGTVFVEKLSLAVFPDAKVFQQKKGKGNDEASASSHSDDQSNNTPLQRRFAFRVLCEAHLVGVLESAKPVFLCVAEFCKARHGTDSDNFAHSLASLASFAKLYGEEFIGAEDEGEKSDHPESKTSEDGTQKNECYRLSPERRTAFREMLLNFHVIASLALLNTRQAVAMKEKEVKRSLEKTGEVSDANAAALAELKKTRLLFCKNLETLTEALGGEEHGVRMPAEVALDDDGDDTATRNNSIALSKGVDVEIKCDAAFWDDDDERFFYESLPALKETVPSGLLPAVGVPTVGIPPGSELTTTATVTPSLPQLETQARLAEFEGTILAQIKQCHLWTAKSADKFSSDFCYHSPGPVARALLVASVLTAVRSEGSKETATSVSPVACIARVLATLASTSKVFEDEIVKAVVSAVHSEFDECFGHLDARKRSTGNQKTHRDVTAATKFLGELVKFRVVPSEWVFGVLKLRMDKFREILSVETVCCLLLSCGRYLSRRLDTRRTTVKFLDVFLRLKAHEGLSAKHSSLVDTTYLACVPPLVSSRRKKVKHPIQLWVKFVVDKAMREWVPAEQTDTPTAGDHDAKKKTGKKSRSPDTKDDVVVRKTVRSLRKLDWHTHERYVIQRLFKGAVSQGNVQSAACATKIVCGLDVFRESAVSNFVDAVLEENRCLTETNGIGTNQRRIACGRLLGQLFVSKLIGVDVVFAQLYAALGPPGPENEKESLGNEPRDDETETRAGAIDAPHDLIRVRVALAVLNTVLGRLDIKKIATPQVQRYLTYFQRFALSKRTTPDVAMDVRDVLKSFLGEEYVPFANFADANHACLEIEKQEQLVELSGGAFGVSRTNPREEEHENERENGAMDEGDEETLGEDDFGEGEYSASDSGDDAGDAMEIGERDDGVNEDVDDEGGEGDESDSDASRSESESSESSQSESDSDGEVSEQSEQSSSSTEATDSEFLTDDDEYADTVGPLVSSRTPAVPPRPTPSREELVSFEREMLSFLGPRVGGAVGGDTSGKEVCPNVSLGGTDRYGGRGRQHTFDARQDQHQPQTPVVAKKVVFKVLVKREGKYFPLPHSASLIAHTRLTLFRSQSGRAVTGLTAMVPENAPFVVSSREKAAADRVERAELKRLVLLSTESNEVRPWAFPFISQIRRHTVRSARLRATVYAYTWPERLTLFLNLQDDDRVTAALRPLGPHAPAPPTVHDFFSSATFARGGRGSRGGRGR